MFYRNVSTLSNMAVIFFGKRFEFFNKFFFWSSLCLFTIWFNHQKILRFFVQSFSFSKSYLFWEKKIQENRSEIRRFLFFCFFFVQSKIALLHLKRARKGVNCIWFWYLYFLILNSLNLLFHFENLKEHWHVQQLQAQRS